MKVLTSRDIDSSTCSQAETIASSDGFATAFRRLNRRGAGGTGGVTSSTVSDDSIATTPTEGIVSVGLMLWQKQNSIQSVDIFVLTLF